MATEKILNTRIQLKYDSLKNWTDANTLLKAGEVAVAYLPPKGNGVIPEPTASIEAPASAVLMKVGPGNFNDLPWVSALAADVYAWAKESNLTINKEGTGNVVSGIEWDATANDGKGGIKFTTAAVATAEGLDELQKDVAALEKDIADNRDSWNRNDTDTKYEFILLEGDAVQEADKDYAGQLKIIATPYTNGVAGTSTAQYVDFVTLAELEAFGAQNYYTKTEVDGLISDVEDKIPTDLGVMSVAGSGAITATGDENVTVGLKLDNSGNVTLSQGTNGLKAEVDTGVHSVALTGGTDNGTLKLTVDGAATDNIAVTGLGDLAFKDSLAKADVGLGNVDNTSDVNKPVSTAQAQAIADALAEAKKYADDNDANDNTEYHVEYDSANKKIKLVAGADSSKMEIPTDDFIKDGMIQSVAISEDGKNLVITWNTDAGKEATTIALSELVDVMTGVDGTTIKVDVSADDKISAEVKAGSITTSHIAPTAGIVKTQLATDVQTSLGKADTALQEHQRITTEVSTFDSNTAMVTVNGTGIHKITGSDPITVTATPNADLITVGLDAAKTKTALGLKSAAYTESTAYATAAQGAKADSAVQSVTVGVVDPTTAPAIALIVDGTQTNIDFVGSDGVKVEGDNAGTGSATNKLTFSIDYTKVATAAQGALADTALQSATGNVDVTPIVDGTKLKFFEIGLTKDGKAAKIEKLAADNSVDLAGIKVNNAVQADTVADHAIGAHQTKACADYNGADAEVWVFNCGSATVNV